MSAELTVTGERIRLLLICTMGIMEHHEKQSR